MPRLEDSKRKRLPSGGFNAKTGREWNNYPENIGRYGKGDLNSNGKQLLEFCNRQGLVLTNTLFPPINGAPYDVGKPSSPSRSCQEKSIQKCNRLYNGQKGTKAYSTGLPFT